MRILKADLIEANTKVIIAFTCWICPDFATTKIHFFDYLGYATEKRAQ